MKKRNGLTLIDSITGIIILTLMIVLILLFLFWMRKALRSGGRVVCATNLKGLGTAMAVYSQDYDDEFPRLGFGPWSKKLGYSYEDAKFKPYKYEGPCTITSSLYLLVREADVSPKSFVCPRQPEDTEFNGQNSKNLDIVELWDFGNNPYQHVSYAYHNPYGKYPADGSRSASFAVMAGMSPWMKDGDFLNPNQDKNLPPQIISVKDATTFVKGNSMNHTEYEEDFLYFFLRTRQNPYGFGQPVTFADGHVAFEKQPNIGVNNDNIFTYWSTEENPSEQDIQGGTAPTSR
ncbi:MAG: hypothetical protein ACYS9H_08955, partial [Planctomycetota bacterium]